MQDKVCYKAALVLLVLTRKAGSGDKSILTIGAEMEVTVLEVSGEGVRLGITAPPSVCVDRAEIPFSTSRKPKRRRTPRPECRSDRYAGRVTQHTASRAFWHFCALRKTLRSGLASILFVSPK